MPPLAGAAAGAALGGLAAPALGGTVAAGIGAGTTLGGLVPSLFGGGGGGGTTNVQPQAGTSFQVYQPQNQPGLDQAYQNLLSPLYNQATGGVQSFGNISPAQAVYPQASGIAQAQAAPGTLPGSYGPYGDVALGKNLWSLSTLQDIYGGPQNLINYGQQAGGAGLSDIPAVQAAAFNPQIGQSVQNVINNPYLQQQLAGAQAGANIGGQAAGLTPQQTQLLNTLGGQLPALGQQAAATTTAQIPQLQGAVNQILQTGMDPQSALYNRTAQQVRDQQQAINAMSGVGTSPYGAGVTGQTMANFNIDWQNQQLQRQLAAGQGAGGLATQAGGLAGQGLQQQLNAAQTAGGLFAGGLQLGQGGSALAAQAGALPASAYQQQQANALAALQSQNQLAGAGVTNLANLTSQLSAAGQQPLSALASINQLAAQPYNTAQAQGANALQALSNQVNFGNQLYTLPQNVLNDIQSYLRLGQSASSYGGQLALQNQQATASQLAGLGGLAGGVGNLLGGGTGGGGAFSPTGLFGSQGPFSSGGLFGSQGPLFGPTPASSGLTGLTPADISVFGSGPDALSQSLGFF